MKLILGILFILVILGILVLCIWLRLKSEYNAYLNQLIDPENNPPDNKKIIERIIKRFKKDKKRK